MSTPKAKLRLTAILVTALFNFNVYASSATDPGVCEEGLNPKLAEDKLHPKMKTVDALEWANGRFPQDIFPINVAFTAKFLSDPWPLREMSKPDAARLNDLAKHLNRLHGAYGIKVRFRVDQTKYSEDVKVVELEVLDRWAKTFQDKLVNTIFNSILAVHPDEPMLLNWKKLRPPTSWQELPNLMDFMNQFLSDPNSAESAKLKSFGRRIDAILVSREVHDLAVDYRDTIRFKNSINSKPPRRLLDSGQVNGALQTLIEKSLADEFPELVAALIRLAPNQNLYY